MKCKKFINGKRKVIALVCLSMGSGMLLVLILPGWGFLLAGVMVIYGFWELFC